MLSIYSDSRYNRKWYLRVQKNQFFFGLGLTRAGLGFPDISSLEPLAKALDLSVIELMRSEKEDMDKKTEQFREQELTELMKQAVEINRINQRQDKTATWIAGVLTVSAAVILWLTGKANLLGGAFIGAIAAIAVIGLYLYSGNRKDKEGSRIYAAFMLGGTAGSISLLNLIGVSDRILMWIMYFFLTLSVVWSNRQQ